MITEAWRVLIYYDKRQLNVALCILKKTPEQVLYMTDYTPGRLILSTYF